MSEKKRASLNLDYDKTVDIGEFSKKKPSQKNVVIDPSIIKEVAEQSGFVSRQPSKKRKQRRRSPYTVQTNFKTRPGMKELIQEVGERLNAYDQEVIEFAINALLEKEDLADLVSRFQEITGDSVI
jgi:hypothetical protein